MITSSNINSSIKTYFTSSIICNKFYGFLIFRVSNSSNINNYFVRSITMYILSNSYGSSVNFRSYNNISSICFIRTFIKSCKSISWINPTSFTYCISTSNIVLNKNCFINNYSSIVIEWSTSTFWSTRIKFIIFSTTKCNITSYIKCSYIKNFFFVTSGIFYMYWDANSCRVVTSRNLNCSSSSRFFIIWSCYFFNINFVRNFILSYKLNTSINKLVFCSSIITFKVNYKFIIYFSISSITCRFIWKICSRSTSNFYTINPSSSAIKNIFSSSSSLRLISKGSSFNSYRIYIITSR